MRVNRAKRLPHCPVFVPVLWILFAGLQWTGTSMAVWETGCVRTPLPAPSGTVVTVVDVGELWDAVGQANSTGHLTILLADGIYELDDMIGIWGDHVAFRGRSGDRDAVILHGQGMTGSVSHIFNVAGSHFTVADMTIGWVANHAVQLQCGDPDSPLIHNVRFVDTGEQMLKVPWCADGSCADNGVVEWCLFEYTAGIGPQYYIGGVDIHQAGGWIIRHCVFKHIRSPESALAEHAVHIWNGAGGSQVVGNMITDCDRGIGFGLGSQGHTGGAIHNNMVHTTRDVGIGLESAPDATVYHNTLYTENYFNSVEYRFGATTGVDIANNLCNAAIAGRDGGTATVRSNRQDAVPAWFRDAPAGDLHLAYPVTEVVDQAIFLAGLTTDLDCQSRPAGAAADLGADEFGAYARPGDLDADGALTAVDLEILHHYLQAHLPPNVPPFLAPLSAADVDGDGGTNSADLDALAAVLAGNPPV
ncbi:MAG: right-handed parallel beta-helix repeat-containing protein [Acidobacteria bacterium]|nr:right-handed parallel beta-helix repeat-containing protein [Acidobacteriota bacterium]